MWPVNMTGETKSWPVNSQISSDIVRWPAVISRRQVQTFVEKIYLIEFRYKKPAVAFQALINILYEYLSYEDCKISADKSLFHLHDNILTVIRPLF